MIEDKLERGENTGVIVAPRITDFMAGAETGIVYEVRNPEGDWEGLRSTDELQRRYVSGKFGYDTLSCVTFSALNSIEAQIEWLLANGSISASDKKLMEHLGYFDENGKVNFSDWFSAIVNGTSEDGNYLQAPWDSFRKDGLLPQKDGRSVNEFTTQEQWLDPANITPAMRAKAKMFLEIFEVKYEWVVLGMAQQWPTFDKHVKQAPLHVVHPTGDGWNTKNGIVPSLPGVLRCNHATCYIGKTPEYKKHLDHYVPYVKKLANDYYVPYAIKGVVSVKGAPVVEPPFKYEFKVNLRHGMPDTFEVRQLQKALQSITGKDGKAYMAKGVFGPYGPATKTAVGKFQADRGIPDPDGAGTNFGPLTRASMNRTLSGL